MFFVLLSWKILKNKILFSIISIHLNNLNLCCFLKLLKFLWRMNFRCLTLSISGSFSSAIGKVVFISINYVFCSNSSLEFFKYPCKSSIPCFKSVFISTGARFSFSFLLFIFSFWKCLKCFISLNLCC